MAKSFAVQVFWEEKHPGKSVSEWTVVSSREDILDELERAQKKCPGCLCCNAAIMTHPTGGRLLAGYFLDCETGEVNLVIREKLIEVMVGD